MPLFDHFFEEQVFYPSLDRIAPFLTEGTIIGLPYLLHPTGDSLVFHFFLFCHFTYCSIAVTDSGRALTYVTAEPDESLIHGSCPWGLGGKCLYDDCLVHPSALWLTPLKCVTL